MFLEVLEAYSQTTITTHITPLSNGGLEGVAKFFENLVVRDSESDMRDFGCILLNAAMNCGGELSSKVAECAKRHYEAGQSSL